MLQNARVATFTVSEFLRENQQEGWGGGGKITPSPHPTQNKTKQCQLKVTEKKEHLNVSLAEPSEVKRLTFPVSLC